MWFGTALAMKSRAMKSLWRVMSGSGVWSLIIADKYLQNRPFSECLFPFYQRKYNIRGLVKAPFLGFIVGLCGGLETGIRSPGKNSFIGGPRSLIP